MAIGRQILSGLFGATAGGLSGFAQQKAEERARMQRQMERGEERAYQMSLIEQEREYAQRIATERDLLEGRIRLPRDRPEVDIQPTTLPSQLLRDVVSGTAPGIGMAAGATGPSPLSMARGGREFLPEAELRADFTPTAMAPPARELIERGGQFYEVITPQEQAARRLEAERGGLDAIEVARLREVARGSGASPEREEARAALFDIGVSYRTEEETEQERSDAAIRRVEAEEKLRRAFEREALEETIEAYIDRGISPENAVYLARGLSPRQSPAERMEEHILDAIAEYASTSEDGLFPTEDEVARYGRSLRAGMMGSELDEDISDETEDISDEVLDREFYNYSYGAPWRSSSALTNQYFGGGGR